MTRGRFPELSAIGIVESQGMLDSKRPGRIPALVVPVLILSALVRPVICEGYESLLEKGMKELAGDRLDQALQSWCLARQLSPPDPRSYVLTAQALLDAGRDHDAVIDLVDLLDLPSSAASAATVSGLLLQAGMESRAIELLERHRRDPVLPAEGRWTLSQLYLQAHKTEESLAALDEFALLRPDDPRIAMLRGRLFLKKGQLEEALTSFEEVLKAEPENAEAYFQMATTLHLGNNPEATERIALRASELDPDSAGSLHVLALARHSLKKNEEAISDLQRAARKHDVFARVYFDLGNIYRAQGDLQKSREALTRYSELQKQAQTEKNRQQRIVQLVNQGETSLHNGEIEKAVDAFTRALESDPREWNSRLFLAKIFLSSGRPDMASLHLTKLLEIDPDSSEAAYLAAFFEQERGNTSRALALAERSRRLRPSCAELRNLLGNVYLALSRPEKALHEYRAARQLAPDIPAFRANYESLAGKYGLWP